VELNNLFHCKTTTELRQNWGKIYEQNERPKREDEKCGRQNHNLYERGRKRPIKKGQ
jgi:hypothetical protein